MQLDKHLIATTFPVADERNVVLWDKYRVTILGNRLFRIEKSPKKQFRDQATQSVWFRNAKAQNFSVDKTPERLTITTSRCVLYIYKKRKDCKISIDGNAPVAICNDGNLKGTYRTLDRCNGNRLHVDFETGEYKRIKLGDGVCSRTGIAVLNDEKSLTLSPEGHILPERGNGTDEYVFAFGNDYRGALSALYAITGKTPYVPRFALGNWWSRYYPYTQEEYMKVLQRFKDRDVPLTVATIDMDWHYANDVLSEKGITESGRIGEFYGTEKNNASVGWTGYSWNKNLFPDYKKMLAEIKHANLKITLNLHPADGVRFWEDQYEDMAKVMGVDAATGQKIEFDIADSKFINAYFSLLHKPYERDGVDFWWIDWQQGEKSKMEGLDPLWSLNHYHYLDNALNHKNPLILSRYAGVGSHRYPLGFTGDTDITWETLKYLPYFTLTASNVGYTWWSHDIGGHHMGIADDELFVRSLQFGVFNPINRLHCSNWDTISKEPWLHRNGSGEIAMQWMRLRHKLIPYLYTASHETSEHGKPLVEPLYYYWDKKQAYEYTSEYVFGGQLIVAPVTSKRRADGFARTRVWIPEGVWTDIFTGDRYVVPEGGCEKTLLRTLDGIPVLAKSGGILPLSEDKGNSVENPTNLKIDVWAGNGNYTLFEDDREHGNKNEAFTTFVANYKEIDGKSVQTVAFSLDGNSSVVPENRIIKLCFKDIPKGEVTVLKGGRRVDAELPYADCVTVPIAFNPAERYEVTVKYDKPSDLDIFKQTALKVLMTVEGVNMDKLLLWYKIRDAETIEECIKETEVSKISNVAKLRIKETL